MADGDHGVPDEPWTADKLKGLAQAAGATPTQAETDLRDRFAVAALPAVVAYYGLARPVPEELALQSYLIADAMMRARKQ